MSNMRMGGSGLFLILVHDGGGRAVVVSWCRGSLAALSMTVDKIADDFALTFLRRPCNISIINDE